jgi:DHA1 family bicyclomycin/chloramphenicol resistance-like MFS transporter
LQRWALRALAGAGLTGLLLALTGLAGLETIMACILAYMFSQGFVNPNSAALALSEQGHRLGMASAMMGTLQLLCGSAAGLCVSVWQADSGLPLAGVMAGCACLAWGFGRVARPGSSS